MATGRQTVAPGQTIASQWGNLVWDQSIQDFATVADRGSQHPSPKPGNAAWLEDTKTLTIWTGTNWQNVMISLAGSGGAVSIQSQNTVVTTNSGAGFSVTFPVAFPVGAQPRIVAMDGDVPAGGPYDIAIIAAQVGNTSWGGKAYQHNAGGVLSGAVRMHYIAVW